MRVVLANFIFNGFIAGKGWLCYSHRIKIRRYQIVHAYGIFWGLVNVYVYKTPEGSATNMLVLTV